MDQIKAKLAAMNQSSRNMTLAVIGGLFLIIFLFLPQVSALGLMSTGGLSFIFGWSVAGSTYHFAAFTLILAIVAVLAAIAVIALPYVKNDADGKKFGYYAAIVATVAAFIATILASCTGEAKEGLSIGFIGLVFTLIVGVVMILVNKCNTEIK